MKYYLAYTGLGENSGKSVRWYGSIREVLKSDIDIKVGDIVLWLGGSEYRGLSLVGIGRVRSIGLEVIEGSRLGRGWGYDWSYVSGEGNRVYVYERGVEWRGLLERYYGDKIRRGRVWLEISFRGLGVSDETSVIYDMKRGRELLLRDLIVESLSRKVRARLIDGDIISVDEIKELVGWKDSFGSYVYKVSTDKIHWELIESLVLLN